MIHIDIACLAERLHPVCRHMLEQAAVLCVSQQEAEIRAEHLLLAALETPLSDIWRICKRAKLDTDALKALLQTQGMTQPPHSGYPVFSPLLVEWIQDSWLLASAEMCHHTLRSGVLLLVLLMTPQRYVTVTAGHLLATINRELLRQNFTEWVMGSAENDQHVQPAQHNATSIGENGSMLARFTHNVTEKARNQQLDPVLCREREVDLMIDILCRRRKNNPIVVGEAGVGKSALTEGLALRIVADRVPEKLRSTEILSLDLGAMQAGASVKGEFEKRFKGVMQEIRQSVYPVILFIDEAHTLIGAGNQQGGLDIANLLKPALARGEMRTIATTTWREYKKHIEKDAALSRRFQLVKVAEPDIAASTVILRGLRSVYEQAHCVLVDEEALQAASELSARYLAGRQLPDKAIDVLDTACARVAISLTTPPRQISLLHNSLQQRQLEISQLQRQQRIALGDNEQRLNGLYKQQQQDQQTLEQLEHYWHQQRQCVEKIIALRGALLTDDVEENPPAVTDSEQTGVTVHNEETPVLIDTALASQAASGSENVAQAVTETEDTQQNSENLPDPAQQLAALEKELAQLQQGHEQILVSPHVNKAQVTAVIAEWTGVPLNRISQNELDVLTRLPEYLTASIKGQQLAISRLHRHLLTARADLRRTGRPLGTFLLVGPSGVGKTETVLCLTDLLFGGRAYLTTINMSEYQEKHTVSRLIGSPHGYVGFGEGGVLTEAIRQKPYSVVLLDEVEKAHPDVLNLFYQAFDKGELADGEGQLIDCKNVVFFLTSNLGYQTIVAHSGQPEILTDVLYPELAEFFKPALLARMETVPYLPLDASTLLQIVHDKLERLAVLLRDRFAADVSIEDSVAQEILRQANRSENGARMLESVIDGGLLPPVSLQILQRLSEGQTVRRIRLAVAEGQFISDLEG